MIERKDTCPLCKKTMPLSALSEHIDLERREIRDYTMQHIRASHPGWVTADGDCPKCQDFYDRL
jgi:hypothetical protein